MAIKTFETTISKIKEHGYWFIRFYPESEFMNENIEFDRLHNIMRLSSVNLRGWDYPHFPLTDFPDRQERYNKKNFIESWVNSGAMKEVWRLSRTGQFIHYLALYDDWWSENDFFGVRDIPPDTFLNFVDAIYTITQVFVFLKKLFENGYYSEETVVVEIKLNKAMNRLIWTSDMTRAPLFGEYRTRDDTIEITPLFLNKAKLYENHLDISLKVIKDVFQLFSWNPPESLIRADQKRLIERRF